MIPNRNMAPRSPFKKIIISNVHDRANSSFLCSVTAFRTTEDDNIKLKNCLFSLSKIIVASDVCAATGESAMLIRNAIKPKIDSLKTLLRH
jgi:hypothetical protein